MANPPSLRQAFAATLVCEFKLALRRPGDILNPLMFYVLVCSLFPLGITPDPEFLQQIAPGVVWSAALLAMLLSLDSLFKADFEDGTLEQVVLSPHSLSVLVLAKILSHWLVSGLPVALMAPLVGGMLALSLEAIGWLFLSLLLGTPVLSLLGTIGAALTAGLKRGGVLLPLLILPLAVPVLIFATGAVTTAQKGLDASGHLLYLAAFLALALSLAPPAAALGLKISTKG